MMVKVEHGDDPALPPEDAQPMSPVVDGFDDYYGYDDEEGHEEQEETDSDGSSRGSGESTLKKGPWTPDEDRRLRDYVQAHGEGNWNQVRINAGLNRCGKSCRLRWSNHLRPDLKKGPFDEEEVEKILKMHRLWGNKWAKMAAMLPGRTDNEIKNYWNTRLKRHERAGLPIYPEYLASQASNQDMNFSTPEALCGTKRSNEFSRNIFEMDLMNEYFDRETLLRLVPLLKKDLADQNYLLDEIKPLKLLKHSGCIASDYNVDHLFGHILDEYKMAGCSTSFNPGMTDNQLASLGNATGHPIFDGNPSTSWTTQRSMEMELPSVQYSNYGLSNVSVHEQADSLIASPGSLKSESISPQNTGLVALGHKGDGIVDPITSQGVFGMPLPPLLCNHNQVSQSDVYSMWHAFSSVLDDEIEGCPVGEIQASKSPSSDAILAESKCYPDTTFTGSDAILAESKCYPDTTFTGSDAILAESKCYPDTTFTGNHLSTWADTGMLNASLEASMFNDRSLLLKDQSISVGNSLLDGDSSEEAKLSTADNSLLDGDSSEEAKPSTAGQGLGSFPWNSMPGACNMPDNFSNL